MRADEYAVDGSTHRVYERTYDEDEHLQQTEADDSGPASCPECDGQVITNAAETICADCGLVLAATPVDRGPDWSWAAEREDHGQQRHTGAPRTVARHDDGLSTRIGTGRDGKGQPLSTATRRRFGRLRREQRRARFRSKAERNCAAGLSEIRRLAGQLDLSRDGRDHACRLFRRAQDDDLLRGRSIEMIATGAVYAACRARQEVRPLGEIAGVASCSRQQVRHGYQVLVREYDLATPPYPVLAWVAQVTAALDVDGRAAARSRRLARRATAAGLSNGRQRAGVAAACVYLAAQEYPPTRSQVACAEAADTSTATLRERVQDLEALGDEGATDASR